MCGLYSVLVLRDCIAPLETVFEILFELTEANGT